MHTYETQLAPLNSLLTPRMLTMKVVKSSHFAKVSSEAIVVDWIFCAAYCPLKFYHVLLLRASFLTRAAFIITLSRLISVG